MKIDIEARKVWIEHGQTVETALRYIIDENIFPQGSVDIRKLSKDFIREMRQKAKWTFNPFLRDYMRVEFGQEFCEEITGKE